MRAITHLVSNPLNPIPMMRAKLLKSRISYNYRMSRYKIKQLLLNYHSTQKLTATFISVNLTNFIKIIEELVKCHRFCMHCACLFRRTLNIQREGPCLVEKEKKKKWEVQMKGMEMREIQPFSTIYRFCSH